MPGVRLGAFPGGVRRGDLNLDLEGALFGLLEGLKAAEKPRGQGPGKAPGMESLQRARVLGRLGRGARSPRTKTAGTVGSTDAAQRCPNELGACGANKLSCSGGAGWGGRAGGFSPELLLSSTCQLSTSAQPSPTPVSSPPPRASIQLDSSSLSSPLLLLPLAFLPHFSPVVSPVSSFVFSPPSLPGASLLLRAAEEEVNALRPGPARHSGRRFCYFSRVIW